MEYVVQLRNGKFVRKRDGMNNFVDRPIEASRYYSKESAESGKIGHHRDMGGSGFIGQIVPYQRVAWLNER